MKSTTHRIQSLKKACAHPLCIQLLGEISAADLRDWLTADLGRADALDAFTLHGDISSRAYAPETLLHIVSGNTPHAAFQSLLRGMLLGSRNIIKLPSSGLPELNDWVSSFDETLLNLVELREEIPDALWFSADAVVAIGSDTTISTIQQKIQPHQIFIPHGHKVSIGIIDDDLTTAAVLAAKDASLFNQRGCLSPHAFYVDADHCHKFAEMLALAMQNFAARHPPEALNLSEAGALRNLRETVRFTAANSDTCKLWESPDNLNWTVIYEATPTLKLSCLNRCIYVRPLPETLSSHALGAESSYLSTVSLHPFTTSRAEQIIASLPAAHRICPLGKTQEPSLFWHHDGFASLQSLVKWKDIG